MHNYNIPLIVDEAHGPHLSFNDKLPVSAMDAGADICAQSTHKIIGALTQCSLLQVRSGRINIQRVQQVLNMLQTTSPSYILMASLDCARRQIALHGDELLEKLLLSVIMQEMKSIKFRVFIVLVKKYCIIPEFMHLIPLK